MRSLPGGLAGIPPSLPLPAAPGDLRATGLNVSFNFGQQNHGLELACAIAFMSLHGSLRRK